MFSSRVWRDRSIFSIKNLRQFVLNVPGTYPAWEINGEMICGMMSPTLSTYPLELKFSLKENWILDEQTVQDCFDSFNIRKKLFLKKLGDNFELLTFVVRLPDHISHLSKGSIAETLNYISMAYIKIDKFLGDILKSHYFDNIFIFSDHGLTKFYRGFSFRRWLEKKRLIFINTPKNEKYYSISLKLFDVIRPFINISKIKRVYKDFILMQNKRKKSEEKPLSKREKSMIGFRSGNVGVLYLRGKDKLKRDKIKKQLLNEPIIREIIEPVGDDVPDFFIILNEKYFFDHHPAFSLKRNRTTIGHKEYGIFIAYGNEIKKNIKFEIVNYQNIAPTILKACHIKLPNHMQGKPLDIFNDPVQSER